MTNAVSCFSAKTTLYHGLGSQSLAGTEAAKRGIDRALIVTDRGVRGAGLLAGIEESLAASKVTFEVYDDVRENADVAAVHGVSAQIKEAGCNGVVVVGGGSSICAAKGGALEATNNRDIRSFEGYNKYDVPPLPLVCLPTTAGSGSDVTAGFPVFDPERQRDFGIAGDNIQPAVSILDPLLLKTCPPKTMVYAGLDALSHALEALWATRASPVTDALAYEAVRLVMENLKAAALTGDMEAKSRQHLAASLACLATGSAGMGVIHAITVSVVNMRGPHGYKCGMLLPYGIEFHMAVCEDKLARMATILGEASGGKTAAELAGLFLHRVKQLLLDLDFPRRFSPEAFSEERITRLLEEVKAFGPYFMDSDMRKVTDKDIVDICRASLRGWDTA